MSHSSFHKYSELGKGEGWSSPLPSPRVKRGQNQ